MLCVAGTVPSKDFPLLEGYVKLIDEKLQVSGKYIDVNRGTPALLAAAAVTANVLGQPLFTYLVGDTGTGNGSRHLYAHMADILPCKTFETITFHYLQPIVHWHKKLQVILGTLTCRPRLIADAGFMYAAKMSGEALLYDLFTPDVGELAFLADEEAPHPFYTRGFILHEANRIPELISRAYKHKNAARYLLVKGETDYLANVQGILGTVSVPATEELEAIGGTGDTLTGIVSVLIDSGMPIEKAALAAMKINRIAGHYACPTPATQIIEIIRYIPQALHDVLKIENLESVKVQSLY
ncbi:MAG: sugar kinase [Deltaproteobacteria bacterium]|nr:sugar kinase [Deltaproteobacteria bacterium]